MHIAITVFPYILLALAAIAYARSSSNWYRTIKYLRETDDIIDLRHDKLMKRVQAEVESNAKMRREIIQLRHELLRVKSAVRKPKWVKDDVK